MNERVHQDIHIQSVLFSLNAHTCKKSICSS